MSFSRLPLLFCALLMIGCASRGDSGWKADAEVTAPHAPFYRKQPNKKGPTAAPFIYLQQGTGVRIDGKTKHGHTEISLPNEMTGWVSKELIGPVGSAPAPSEDAPSNAVVSPPR